MSYEKLDRCRAGGWDAGWSFLLLLFVVMGEGE
jgi:hypothetical protein